jgi:uncharacterized protein YfaP (DUF2135 family)
MQKRGLIGLVILGIFAMAISTASATVSAPRGAGAAKKKCKKRHSAKKECAKKKRRKADAPHSPVIRATLTWGIGASDADVDLHVFDTNGNQAGNGSNTIPLSSFSGDVAGSAGSETFTDGLFTSQAARDLSFGVCYSGRGAPQMNFTITYVTADGVIHGDSQSPASSSHFNYPGGAPIPSNYCPGTNLVP